jgi:MscS family membrane protein
MENYFWLIKIAVGILVLIAIQTVIKAAALHAEKNHRTNWKARLGKIIGLPLSVLLWILGILYFLEIITTHTGFTIPTNYLHATQKAALVIYFTWIFYRWKKEAEHALRLSPSKRIDYTTLQIISRLATIILLALSVLILLQIFGVNVAPLIAFGSIGAASIGFASKDVIANFCSGLMLHISRPFVMGDLIQLPEKNLEGFVEEIGWFQTSIRDKEKRPIYIPNNFFSTMPLINSFRRTHRHIKQQIKIKFGDIEKLSQIIDRMRAYLENDPLIDTRCPLNVFLKSFTDYACEIEIEAYSVITDEKLFNQFQNTTLLKLVGILKTLGVQLAIPVMHLQQEG